jgi:hypothetical protein
MPIFRSNAQAAFAGVLLVLALAIALSACTTPSYLQGYCSVDMKLKGEC